MNELSETNINILLNKILESIEVFETEHKNSVKINHSATKGEVREDFLKGLLERFVPKCFGLKNGLIYGNNKFSNQIDLIIYDYFNTIEIPLSNRHSIIDSDSIYGTISVKSILNKNELFDSMTNFNSVRDTIIRNNNKQFEELTKKMKEAKGEIHIENENNILKMIFAYEGLSEETLSEHLAIYEKNKLPDIIYIHKSKTLFLKYEKNKDGIGPIDFIYQGINNYEGYIVFQGSKYALPSVILYLIGTLKRHRYIQSPSNILDAAYLEAFDFLKHTNVTKSIKSYEIKN